MGEFTTGGGMIGLDTLAGWLMPPAVVTVAVLSMLVAAGSRGSFTVTWKVTIMDSPGRSGLAGDERWAASLRWG